MTTDDTGRYLRGFKRRKRYGRSIADLQEDGRRLASERDDLIAEGVNPADLLIPEYPE